MDQIDFQRIAIVNRGEPAVRLIHAVAELNREREAGLTTIALHTEAERSATFVRMADEAQQLGSGSGSVSPYLDYVALESALVACGADAAWVGWGFVAEHPEFADMCSRLGVTFIGPNADSMRLLGDKIGAKLLAEQVGVPVAPWSGGSVDSVEDARFHAAEIGFPLLLKATAGGGGRGIRRVDGPDEIEDAFERARSEAEKSFGVATVFMEHLMTGARHVEVQVAADTYGNAWSLGVRDCSIQRRNQKVLEESASPVLSAEQNRMLGQAATELVVAAGYCNVGTVEYLFQPETGSFAFLEVNTRLQVEHPVTELTTGIDLVKLQLDIASGARLDGEAPVPVGHAIEARLNAEDPSAGFAPASGAVTALRFPSGPGVRIDSGIVAGDRIQPEYDAMVAKVMAWGRDRGEARARLINALEETVVAVEGGGTNRTFLHHLLQREEFVDGSADTSWLDRHTAAGEHLEDTNADIALLSAAAAAYMSAAVFERTAFFAAAARGRPQSSHEPVTVVDCRLRGEQYRLAVQRLSPDTFRIQADGQTVTCSIEHVGEHESRLRIGDTIHKILSMSQGADHLIDVDHVVHRVSRDDARILRCPAPSLVVLVSVEAGDRVRKGDTLVVLEAMKMETQVTAPFDCIVAEVLTGPSMQVDAGSALMTLEATGGTDTDQPVGPRLRIDSQSETEPARPRLTGRERLLAHLDSARWTLLGFDAEPGAVGELVTKLADGYEALERMDQETLRSGLDVLSTFLDVSSLARDRRQRDSETEIYHNPKEYFHQYLRSLDAGAEGLTESFRGKLSKALTHYGLDDLEPTEDLQRAAFRMFNAHKEAADREPLVAVVLVGLKLNQDPLDQDTSTTIDETLSALALTVDRRFPDLANLARSVRYQMLEVPAIQRRKRAALAELRRLVGQPETARLQSLADLANSSLPVVELLGDEAGDPGPEYLLDVLLKRFYPDASVDASIADEIRSATYMSGTEQRFVVAALADQGDLPSKAEVAIALGRELTTSDPLTIDIYVRWKDATTVDNAVAEVVKSITGAPANLQRLTFSGASPDRQVSHFTFVRAKDGSMVEDPVLRRIHPVTADHLQLDRFENFSLSQLGWMEDVHLYRATSRENPPDVRLLSLAVVRDLVPERDEQGRTTSYRAIEQIVAAAAQQIRSSQLEHADGRRLTHNRIVLYLWPAVDLGSVDLGTLSRRFDQLSDGLGLECIEVVVNSIDGDRTEPMIVRFTSANDAAEYEVLEGVGASVDPLDLYELDVLTSKQRGSIYPYELVDRLLRNGGTFTEYAISDETRFEPIERPKGSNTSGFVSGVITTPSSRHQDGITRVLLLGDPTKGLASIAEDECRMVLGACDVAERLGLPLEWYAVSSGARVAMDSGTENMDWIAKVLRRIIEFTQAGGEINMVIAGINVGGQSYWNAEATMLMHTKGVLVMTPDSTMVLTGKQSLDYAGSVSADDNFGIGGYDRIMGPNGQAQYWAPNMDAACEIVRRHTEHSFVVPGERFPRPFPTIDARDRNIEPMPHDGEEFESVGAAFSSATNPGRKKPFDIRSIMRAVADQDRLPMERWTDMRDADAGVIHETSLGGHPVTMIGISSRPEPRKGLIPADGPDQWTAGTLFPQSSKKIARAINAASGSLPLVILANLSGFDGSPESMAKGQLEYGAEIGRAITNFDGPIVFCVISRYHGGAFVVFSKALNDNMQVFAVEGSYASVLGGAPAAAVVFSREVDKRTDADPHLVALRHQLEDVGERESASLRAELAGLRATVRAEKLGEKAAEFDAIHTIERARAVGSVDAIISSSRLRPELIDAVERGMAASISDSAG